MCELRKRSQTECQWNRHQVRSSVGSSWPLLWPQGNHGPRPAGPARDPSSPWLWTVGSLGCEVFHWVTARTFVQPTLDGLRVVCCFCLLGPLAHASWGRLSTPRDGLLGPGCLQLRSMLPPETRTELPCPLRGQHRLGQSRWGSDVSALLGVVFKINVMKA